MMTLDWQTLATLALVLLAGGYLGRRAWRTIARRTSGGCGACGSCPSKAGAADSKQLIPLETLSKTASRRQG